LNRSLYAADETCCGNPCGHESFRSRNRAASRFDPPGRDGEAPALTRTMQCAAQLVSLVIGCGLVLSAPFALARDTSSRSRSSSLPRPSIVVIDPGHGGFDRGGIPGQQVPEKTMALDVGLRLKLKLQAAGYRVVMTRDTDVFVPLPTRVAIANSYSNAIFVCIHFNSATRSGANGIETYYYRSDSASLAANIHRNVIAGAPSENRGIRRRGYYVLRRTSIPSVLVECGFLTNPSEAQLALTISYRNTLAEEITRGIMGKPPLVVREPASRNYPAATEMEQQSVNGYAGTDFIKVPPEPTSTRHGKKSRTSSRKTKKKSSHKTSSEKKTSTDKSSGDN
jgi:N-acetylmuramoyl-L-alanine amidase